MIGSEKFVDCQSQKLNTETHYSSANTDKLLVQNKLESLSEKLINGFGNCDINMFQILRYVKKLKSKSSAG